MIIGKIIAGNSEVYQLHNTVIEDFRYVSLRLKSILNLSDREFRRLLKKKNEVKPWDTIVVSDNLTWEQFSRVNSYLYELTGVKSVLSIIREYPHKDNYTHVLGYISQANEKDLIENEDVKEKFVPGLRVGKTGLEKAFEKELLGVNDIQRFEVNAYGKKINQIELQKGSKGQNIRLTLDTEIQKYCSELLADRAGSICVMDIYSGEIVAMQSSPSFDPNLFLFGINQDDWQLIRNNPLKPLVNKTISGKYSPGSTIKPIVALSALENGIVNPQFTVKCEGKVEMYGQTYHCWKEKGHGL